MQAYVDRMRKESNFMSKLLQIIGLQRNLKKVVKESDQ